MSSLLTSSNKCLTSSNYYLELLLLLLKVRPTVAVHRGQVPSLRPFGLRSAAGAPAAGRRGARPRGGPRGVRRRG